jgi:mono/diheme cytochrome c family protein
MGRVAVAALIGCVCLGCGDKSDSRPPAVDISAAEVPAQLSEGADLFVMHCAGCHGEAATGTEQGPPLVHRIYEPSHHGDAAFVMAAMRGVRAHHWRFGDMPAVPGITEEEVAAITAYVRWLQRRAGIT